MTTIQEYTTATTQQPSLRLTVESSKFSSQEEESPDNVWQQCASNFRRSKGDLLKDHYVDPEIYEHMQLPPILGTWNEEEGEALSVHYFARDRADSDSEVECVALPSIPLVPLRRDHSPEGGRLHPTDHTEFHV